MKRKMKKFNEGGETKYNREDEGFFGNKINYREDSEGRKFVAGRANPMDRNPQEQRYYSKDDVKKGLSDVGDKISNFFGGKKEDSSSKFDELESVGGASRRPRTIEEQIGRKAEDKPAKGIASNFKSSEPKFERNDNEKSLPDVKKAARKDKDKGASDDRKSLGDKATPLPGKADDKDKKVTPLPGRGDDNKKPLGKGATPMKEEDDKPAKYEDDKVNIGSQGSFKFDSKPVSRTRAGTVVKSSEEPSALDIAAAKQKSAERLKKQYKENDATFKRIGDAFSNKSPNRSYKSGGSVRSASARADGCAIRGKTRA
jgi:hypothetical protein